MRYFDLEKPVMKEPEAIINYLHLFYKEFMEEKGRREDLVKCLVDDGQFDREYILQQNVLKAGLGDSIDTATDDEEVTVTAQNWGDYFL